MAELAETTGILNRIANGETRAYDELLPKVYAELEKLAVHYLAGERPDHSFEPAELVHEAYLRMVGLREIDWKSRRHFFVVAAQTMRRILIDHARARRRKKRGNGARAESLDERISVGVAGKHPIDLLQLEEALEELEQIDARKVRVVELLYFGGLSPEQTGEILGVSSRTVERDWRYARTWLFGRLVG